MVTWRLAASSATRTSGRYFRAGASRSIRFCSTSLITAVVVTVLEIDASGKTVSAVIGCGSSRFVTPKPRMVARPSRSTPMATPGTRCSRIFAVTSSASFSNVGSGGACARDVVLTIVNTHRHTTAVARGIARGFKTTGLYVFRDRRAGAHQASGAVRVVDAANRRPGLAGAGERQRERRLLARIRGAPVLGGTRAGAWR